MKVRSVRSAIRSRRYQLALRFLTRHRFLAQAAGNHPTQTEIAVGIVRGAGYARQGYGCLHLRRSRTEAKREIYDLDIGIGEIGQIRLHVNQSTGCSWWIESAPPSSVVEISVSEDIDRTIDRGNSPRPGWSNQVVVYSFKSTFSGNYEIELRYGHAWAHSEYYAVAIIHLTVAGPHTRKRK